MRLLVRWLRSLCQQLFYQFGLHCATHQIRVILISGIVITSLFYPALSIYSSHPSSNLLSFPFTPVRPSPDSDIINLWDGYSSLRIHDDAFSRVKCQRGHALRVERILVQSPDVEGESNLNRLLLSTLKLEHRLQEIIPSTEPRCLLRPKETKCLVISPLAFWDYDTSAVSADDSILDTLTETKSISIEGFPVSPFMVLADRGSYEEAEKQSGFDDDFDWAKFFALTFFFPDEGCIDNGEHAKWFDTIKNAVGQVTNGDTSTHAGHREPTLIALEYDENLKKANGWSALSASLYLAYIGFTAYVAWSVRRMDAVHSRLGVTFTALVEIAVSTITSLSVCALVGFKITMVPWEILPIVIIFVGAENMFNLVDAVGKTSVTLSVKQRIAEGLSRAGTSNTLKVVTYNIILGIIAVFAEGAVRQFCIFAIVVLVAHWFLAHTFFMAVLSIDTARLELEELLRYDTNLTPAILNNRHASHNKTQSRSRWQKLVVSTQALLKGRAGTNVSLLLLLAITATLYYTTYNTTPVISTSPTPPLGAVMRSRSRTSQSNFTDSIHDTATISPALSIWKTLNPYQLPLLHLRIETPTIVTFALDSTTDDSLPSLTAFRFVSLRPLHFVLWLLKIMVLPIGATTVVLYGFLLYLLKDTELLEAQRNHAEADGSISGTGIGSLAKKEERSMEGEVMFSTLPRAFASDVELVAASGDARVVVAVGLRGEINIWKGAGCVSGCGVGKGMIPMRIDASDVLLGAASTSYASPSLTAVTVDEDGRYFAVGTGAGVVAAWAIEERGIQKLPLMVLNESYSGVKELRFISSSPSSSHSSIPPPPPVNASTTTHTPPQSAPSSPARGLARREVGRENEQGPKPKLLVTYDCGAAARWVVGESPTASIFTPSRHVGEVRACLVRVISDERISDNNERVLFGFSLEDGTLELVETGDHDLTVIGECCVQAGTPTDRIQSVHACRVQMNGSTRFVVGAASEAGVISLWDGINGDCIAMLDEVFGPVGSLRVLPVRSETCRLCGQLPVESLLLAFEVGSTVRLWRLFVDGGGEGRRCGCVLSGTGTNGGIGMLRHMSSRESMGKSSRSNSVSVPQTHAGSLPGSPRIPRARLATGFETSTTSTLAISATDPTAVFPVSGHGVHSRRASEKNNSVGVGGEMGRRSVEMLQVPPTSFASDGEYDVLGAVPSIHGGSGSLHLNGDGASMSTGSFWRRAIMLRICEVGCERGGWGVTKEGAVGVRKRLRVGVGTPIRGDTSIDARAAGRDNGLTKATMDKWEAWIFEPNLGVVRSTVLSRLEGSETGIENDKTRTLRAKRTTEDVPRLPFTRVSSLVTTSSHALAGFGNTLGILTFASEP